jgi:hypothetical protein
MIGKNINYFINLLTNKKEMQYQHFKNQFKDFTFKLDILKKDFETLSKNYDKMMNNEEMKDLIIPSNLSQNNWNNGLILIGVGTSIFLLFYYFEPKIKRPEIKILDDIFNKTDSNTVNEESFIHLGVIGFFMALGGILIIIH